MTRVDILAGVGLGLLAWLVVSIIVALAFGWWVKQGRKPPTTRA